MADPPVRAELLRATRAAFERHQQKRATLGEGGSARPPRIGDVLRLPATAHVDVEWALVLRDPADPRRFLAIPADGGCLVGSADLPGDSAGRVLRCRFATWVEERTLRTGRRVDLLNPEEVERARRRWLALGEEGQAGSALEREVDEDPEYQDWVEEVLLPARRAVGRGAARLPLPEGGEPQSATSAALAARRPSYAAAASFLLAVCVGAAGLALWRQHRALESARRAAEAINPVSVYLDGRGPTRGPGDDPVRLRARASHLMFFISLPWDDWQGRYRLRIFDGDSDPPIWSRDDLRPEESDRGIWVGLPLSYFRPGTYRLVLEREADGRFEPHSRHELRLLPPGQMGEL